MIICSPLNGNNLLAILCPSSGIWRWGPTIGLSRLTTFAGQISSIIFLLISPEECSTGIATSHCSIASTY